MNWNLPYPSGRQPVLARNVVSTSQPLAAQAGAQAFARGGNAIDAALAAAIALTVVEPTMNGIGGDAFALVWDGTQLHGLNSSGRSPASWTPERFAGMGSMPVRGWDSVTVPGGVAAWHALSDRFGRLPFEDLFREAIRHAREGFPVSPVISRQWSQAASELHVQPGFKEFIPAGRAPRPGEVWKFAAQADTLEEIARTRGESMYRGALAQKIAAFAAEHGAALSASDLAAHQAEWVQPVSVSFAGHEVHEIPPNGIGIAALVALGVMQNLPYQKTQPDSAERMHLEIECMRLAFADAHTHLGDAEHMRVALEHLLDPDYLRSRARLIDPEKAGSYGPGQPPSGGTTYLAAADAEGRMVSFIQSNYKGFGSGVVVPGTGIALHNRALGFVTTPGHVNQVAGGKRPLHSIIPAFLTRQGKPAMAFGVMGGNMQPQGHLQMVMRYVVEGHNPQAASDAPRWRIDDAGQLILEPTVPPQIVEGLRRMGHTPKIMPPGNLEFGSAQLIARLDEEVSGTTDAVYAAGSDHRRDGQAVGY